MTSKKRARIKKAAQLLKAKIQIGASELHQNIFITIDQMFNNNEILKVKVNRVDKDNKTITREIADKIASELKCDVVDVIGTTIILYKENKDPEKRINYEL